jgi:photosystem II stability/assembly factor-like uncharacterized protein
VETDVEPTDLETLSVDDFAVEARTIAMLVADHGDLALRLADGREDVASCALARTYRDWRKDEVADIEARIAREIHESERVEPVATTGDLLTRVDQLVRRDRVRREHKWIWISVACIAFLSGFAPWLGASVAGRVPSRAHMKTEPVVHPRPHAPHFAISTSFVDQQHGFALVDVGDPGQEIVSLTPPDVWFMTTGDGGRTWNYVGPRLVGAVDVAFTDLHHGVVASAGHGARYTDDGGQHWTQTPDLVRSFSAAGRVIWADASQCSGTSCDARVLRSTDGGHTWLATSLSGKISRLELHAVSASTAYVLHDGTLVATEDGGATWPRRPTPCSRSAKIGMAAATAAVTWMTCSVRPHARGDVVAGPDFTFGPSSGSSPPWGRLQLFASRDGGRSWQRVSTPLDGTLGDFQLTASAPEGVVLSNGMQSIRTTDGGRNWKWLRRGGHPADVALQGT